MRFRNRTDAGRRLAEQVRHYELRDPVVLALPRGGVPVAVEVAAALEAPLDVFVARKVGVPGHPERGIGAVAEGGATVMDSFALQVLGLSTTQFDTLVADEEAELDRRVRRYRGTRVLPQLEQCDIILVDDGIATGVTAEAALRALRAHDPGRLLLAVPVCAPGTATRLGTVADEVVCVIAPAEFYAVGEWYDDFGQTSDEEVLQLLERARAQNRSRR